MIQQWTGGGKVILPETVPMQEAVQSPDPGFPGQECNGPLLEGQPVAILLHPPEAAEGHP